MIHRFDAHGRRHPVFAFAQFAQFAQFEPEPAGRRDTFDTSGRWAVLPVRSTAHHPERIT